MKPWIIAIPVIAVLTSCLDTAPKEESSFQFSMTHRTYNQCGLETARSDVEILVYSELGELLERHQADSEGSIRFESSEPSRTLVIADTSGETLDMTVLVDQNIKDYGLWYKHEDSSVGCECQEYELSISPGNLTSNHHNLPYTGTSSFSNAKATYDRTFVCQIPGDVEATLVAYAKDSQTNAMNYFVSESPSSLANESNEIDIEVSQPGRAISVLNDRGTFHYIADQHNAFRTPFSSGGAMVLDHDRVQLTHFSASHQFEINDPAQQWIIDVPMDEHTQLIDYAEPSTDQTQLRQLLQEEISTYDFSQGNSQDWFMIYQLIETGTGDDVWRFLMPPTGDLTPLDIDWPPEFTTQNNSAYWQRLVYKEALVFNIVNEHSETIRQEPEALRQLLEVRLPSSEVRYTLETFLDSTFVDSEN